MTRPISAKTRTSLRVCLLQARRSRSRWLPSACPIWPISLRAPVALHPRQALAAHHQRAGKDKRQIVAARPRRLPAAAVRRALRTGTDSPVSSDSSTARSVRLMRRASAGTRSPSASDDEIAAHHLAARRCAALAVANHQRARAGQIAQRLQHPLAARFLHNGDR